MAFWFVLALVLFTLGLFTAKILWWAALVLATVWLVDKIRSAKGVLH